MCSYEAAVISLHTFSSDDIYYEDLHLKDMPTRMLLWYGMIGEVLREKMHRVNCIAYGNVSSNVGS
jgi:hypothetical protein